MIDSYINFLQLEDTRIQLIQGNNVHYLEDTKQNIIDYNILFSKYNDDPTNDDLKNQATAIINNLPFPYFGKFKINNNKNIYYEDYRDVVPIQLSKHVTAAKKSNDLKMIESLENFQALNMLNVNKEARAFLYEFIDYHGISLTQKGYFIGYKAVRQIKPVLSMKIQGVLDSYKYAYAAEDYLVECTSLNGVVSYSTLNYFTVNPRKKKKLPLTYNFFKNDASVESFKIIGQFEKLYDDLETVRSGVYVDKHTGTITQSLGDLVKMPRVKCDSDRNNGCSVGLHIGNMNYVNSFASSDDVILICLVNPADVIAVPNDVSKMRVCQYFICGFSSLDEYGKIVPPEEMLYDHDYSEKEQSQIELELKAGNFEKYVDSTKESLSKEEIRKIIDDRLKIIS